MFENKCSMSKIFIFQIRELGTKDFRGLDVDTLVQTCEAICNTQIPGPTSNSKTLKYMTIS
jgi:hypothetical protein